MPAISNALNVLKMHHERSPQMDDDLQPNRTAMAQHG